MGDLMAVKLLRHRSKWQESLSWVAGISHEPWGVLYQGIQVHRVLRQVSRVFVL